MICEDVWRSKPPRVSPFGWYSMNWPGGVRVKTPICTCTNDQFLFFISSSGVTGWWRVCCREEQNPTWCWMEAWPQCIWLQGRSRKKVSGALKCSCSTVLIQTSGQRGLTWLFFLNFSLLTPLEIFCFKNRASVFHLFPSMLYSFLSSFLVLRFI